MKPDNPIKEYCNCAVPKPVPQLSAGGGKIAEQCGLCLRIFRAPCPVCGAWLKDVRAHIAEAHRKTPVRRPKREVLTPLEQYFVDKS